MTGMGRQRGGEREMKDERWRKEQWRREGGKEGCEKEREMTRR